MYDPMDPVIMEAIKEFGGKKLVSVESSEVSNLPCSFTLSFNACHVNANISMLTLCCTGE